MSLEQARVFQTNPMLGAKTAHTANYLKETALGEGILVLGGAGSLGAVLRRHCGIYRGRRDSRGRGRRGGADRSDEVPRYQSSAREDLEREERGENRSGSSVTDTE